MAGLFMFAGMAMMDRHRAKKEAKKQKKIFDELRFAELQRETDERLGGCSSEASTPTSSPTSSSGSIFGPPSMTTQDRMQSFGSMTTQDRMQSFRSEYSQDSMYREKSSRRSTWYGMKKESRPQPTQNASWRGSMLFR